MEDFRREQDKELLKESMKEALREWLDEKYAQFGKWSVRGIAAMVLAALIYFVLIQNGWRRDEPHIPARLPASEHRSVDQ